MSNSSVASNSKDGSSTPVLNTGSSYIASSSNPFEGSQHFRSHHQPQDLHLAFNAAASNAAAQAPATTGQATTIPATGNTALGTAASVATAAAAVAATTTGLAENNKSDNQNKSKKKSRLCSLSCEDIKRLPWTAIALLIFLGVVVILFIYFIFNNNGSTSLKGSNSTQPVTVVCTTDISTTDCATEVTKAILNNIQPAINEVHLFTTFIVFSLTSFTFFVIRAIRIRGRESYISTLPKSSIEIWNDVLGSNAGAYVLNGNATGAVTYMKNKMENSLKIQNLIRTTEPESGAGDPNWGTKHVIKNLSEDGVSMMSLNKIHFPSATIFSLNHLEEAAVRYDPKLTKQSNQTAYEYVEFLKREVKGIDHQRLDEWLKYYEEAKYSNHEFTQAKCAKFMDNFGVLLLHFGKN